MAEYLLEMKQIVKQFPGTLALDHVDFTLEQGEVMALIGENGAGKSTLMNVLMGMLQPDSGEMVLRGQTITNRSPYEALQKGIGMVPQELNLVSDLSIAENIFLGLHQKKGNRIDWDHMRSKAKEMLDKLEVDIDPGKKISEVSAAYQQLVSIARTLVFGSNIIITIMRDGKLIKISNTSDLSIDDMIYYMANQKVEKSQHIVRPVPDQVFLKVMGLCRGKEFQNVDFEVKKGEIFGVAGLVGAGRTELFSCLYGLTKKDKGKVYLEGKEVEITSPNEAISYGIGLVPEERRKQGMFPILSIYENIMMPNYHKVTRMGRINFSQAREAANHHIQALRIKTPDCLTQIKNLSGGNQQKVILGRWMEKQVKLFILDEPTRGIDVRAKGEIYKLIRDMADSGITVIVISSEIEELLTLADRIMIMNGGKVKGFVVPNEDMEREDILKVALH